jgi:predicted dehydrogenase
MIRAAIVGLGWWGKTLVESVQGTSNVIQFTAGAARTLSPDIQKFGELHGLKLVQNLDELLADRRIGAIVLATPHSLHTSQVIAAAKAGKHVFCEKPFALHKADAEAAVDAVKKAGVVLGLGYNRRLHPEMNKLRERVRSGGLGTIMHVEALLLKSEHGRADK